MNLRAQVSPSLVGSLQGARKSNCPIWRAAATMAWALLSSWLASTEETICASLTVKPSFWVASRGKPATDGRGVDAEEREHRGRVLGVGQAAHARRQQRVVGRALRRQRRR